MVTQSDSEIGNIPPSKQKDSSNCLKTITLKSLVKHLSAQVYCKNFFLQTLSTGQIIQHAIECLNKRLFH